MSSRLNCLVQSSRSTCVGLNYGLSPGGLFPFEQLTYDITYNPANSERSTTIGDSIGSRRRRRTAEDRCDVSTNANTDGVNSRTRFRGVADDLLSRRAVGDWRSFDSPPPRQSSGGGGGGTDIFGDGQVDNDIGRRLDREPTAVRSMSESNAALDLCHDLGLYSVIFQRAPTQQVQKY